MGKLQVVTTQPEVDSILTGNELAIVKFTASWCGPCKAVAPQVELLHDKYYNVEFCEIDVDQSREVAQKYSISAIPTFIYFHNGTEVQRVRGANVAEIRQGLEALSGKNPKATRGATSSAAASGPSGSGIDETIQKIVTASKFELLNDVISFGQSEVLNVKSTDAAGDLRKLLDVSAESQTFEGIQSDADSQLLLYLPFQNQVKLHSIYIKTAVPDDYEDDGQVPSLLKVWANSPTTISFDDATSGAVKPLHSGDIPEPDSNGWRQVPLRYVLFQNVTSVQLFLDGPDEDASTLIQKIVLIGHKGESRTQGKLEKLEH